MQTLANWRLQSGHSYTIRDSPLQMTYQEVSKSYMAEHLASKADIAEQRESHLGKVTILSLIGMAVIPDFSVAVRRLTPAPGYLHALTADHVSLFRIS